jgi:four helix bundle protein
LTEVPFDIKERTFQFGLRVVKATNALPKTVVGSELTRQLFRAGTSVGANVEEADGAESRKDAAHKMGIARKEARESSYWLRLAVASGLLDDEEIRALIQESNELVKILSRIIQNISRANPNAQIQKDWRL